jgi:hypothetical protein
MAWKFQVKSDVSELITVQDKERYEQQSYSGEAVGSKELAPL